MILLQDSSQEEIILEIVEDWERARVEPYINLLIGEEDYSERIVSGEWGQAEGPAISADITLSKRLPIRLENAPVTLSVDIGGIQIPQLVGHRSRADENREGTTTLLAASLGSLLGKVTFDLTPGINGIRLLEFYGVKPEFIVWNMLARLPYDLSRVSVEPVGEPILSLTGSEGGFKQEQHPTDVLGRVLESVPYQFADTPYGGHEAYLAPDLANVDEIITVYDANEIEWTPPSLIDELYTQVEVFKYNADGSEAFDRVRVDVPYANLEYQPVQGQTLSIPLEDESVNAHAYARQHARDVALSLSRGYRRGEATLPFSPLMRKGDAFGVREIIEDDDGTWEREWICMTDSYKHPFQEFLQTSVGYTASLFSERLVRVPRIRISSGVSGVVKTLAPPATWDETGVAYDVSGTFSWLGEENGDIWIDDALSYGQSGVDENGDWWVEVEDIG